MADAPAPLAAADDETIAAGSVRVGELRGADSATRTATLPVLAPAEIDSEDLANRGREEGARCTEHARGSAATMPPPRVAAEAEEGEHHQRLQQNGTATVATAAATATAAAATAAAAAAAAAAAEEEEEEPECRICRLNYEDTPEQMCARTLRCTSLARRRGVCALPGLTGIGSVGHATRESLNDSTHGPGGAPLGLNHSAFSCVACLPVWNLISSTGEA